MVNSSIYIFGSFDNGYTQYPDNYAKEIYQNLFAQARSKSQIVIHRDKELMYYGYIRQLDKHSQYIGFLCTYQWHDAYQCKQLIRCI